MRSTKSRRFHAIFYSVNQRIEKKLAVDLDARKLQKFSNQI